MVVLAWDSLFSSYGEGRQEDELGISVPVGDGA